MQMKGHGLRLGAGTKINSNQHLMIFPSSQVGENGVFLSEDDVRIIVENNQDTALLIG